MRRRTRSLRRSLGLAACVSLALSGAASADIEQLTIDQRAQLSPGRQIATVTGTITCTAGEVGDLSVRLVQGPVSSQPFGQTFTCTGSPQTYSLEAIPFDDGSGEPLLWRPGRASALVEAFLPNEFEQARVDRLIRLAP